MAKSAQPAKNPSQGKSGPEIEGVAQQDWTGDAADDAAMERDMGAPPRGARAPLAEGHTEPLGFASETPVATEFGTDEDFVRAEGIALKVKKRVLVPSLAMKEGQVVVIRIMEAFRLGKQMIEPKPGRVRMEPGHCALVSSLGGHMRMLWAPTVMYNTILEVYPNDGYVGGWFYITHLGMKMSNDGVKYNSFSIDEIEAPTAGQRMQATAPARQIAAPQAA